MLDVFGVLLGHLPASKRPKTVRRNPYVTRCRSHPQRARQDREGASRFQPLLLEWQMPLPRIHIVLILADHICCTSRLLIITNPGKLATPQHARRNLRTLVIMNSRDDYRLLRLTEPQKAVFGSDNASKHIGIVSKHLYKHVRCVWGVVGSSPGVQAA